MGKWIPITEKLPEKSGDYLISTKSGYVGVAKWGFGLYKGGWNGNCKHCILAWQELPKAYQERKHGEI